MKRTLFLGILAALGWASAAGAAGVWVPLTNFPPSFHVTGLMLLLSDGGVMAEDMGADGASIGPGWFRLTPDIHGSYVNGAWSTVASMHDTRFAFSSDVLKDGRIFVAGGEFGFGTTNGEIYDPVSNSWTIISAPPGLITTGGVSGNDLFPNTSGIADAESVLLANGNVLISPVYPATPGGTLIYNPGSNSFSAGPILSHGFNQSEASWVKLPDDSILTVDPSSTNTQRFIPGSNIWIQDANVPVPLFDPFINEIGPALLLPNGKAIFFGSTGHTAIYTPSGNASPGNWVAGPDLPDGQGMSDAPAAMMANGKILCAVAPTPTAQTSSFPSPTSFYEYDYLSNSFTRVGAPAGGLTLNTDAACIYMLDLADGSVLVQPTAMNAQSNAFLPPFVYVPDGSPLTVGKPAIISASTNDDGSLHLTGTLFNGISQGAAYGDDEQMDSNYPLVRFTDASGNVRYGRSYNWSRTSVMTGAGLVSTECTLPAGASLNDMIEVVANGIASPGFIIAPSPPVLTKPTRLGSGAFQFEFDYASGASFTVFAGTDAAQPVNTWSNLGAALESPAGSGRFQFTDPQANNFPRRFYRVSSP
jgi:hypothetical protein